MARPIAVGFAFHPSAMTSQPALAPLRHARWVWLTVLLAVLGAVMPAISQALAGDKAAAAMEVCTSTGMAWVDAHGDGEAASGQDGSLQSMECPCCLWSVDPLFPAPVAEAGWRVASAAQPAPVARLPFFRLAFAALAPPPRGPPLIS